MKKPERENETRDRKSKLALFVFFSRVKSEPHAAYHRMLPFVEALINFDKQCRAAMNPELKLVCVHFPTAVLAATNLLYRYREFSAAKYLRGNGSHKELYGWSSET